MTTSRTRKISLTGSSRGEKSGAERSSTASSALVPFHPVMQRWFLESFHGPTEAQQQAWPAIARGENTLLLAPTGSGKTLAAFLVALNRIMFSEAAEPVSGRDASRLRVLYISPLKALGVDVERNLRSPLAGVRNVAQREATPYHEPQIGVRSGDTPGRERQQLLRQPPDILITTPESLFLMLTSRARETLRDVETVIIDEIHSLVATKRGAHLFLSLERLERLRHRAGHTTDLQRIGLSATQRPLDEVARLLGGGRWTTDDDQGFAGVPSIQNPSIQNPSIQKSGKAPVADERLQARPVTIVAAGRTRAIELTIEVPVDDMSQLASALPQVEGPAAAGPTLPSIWPAMHPRLVQLIRSHRSTMIFVNSRRLAERLAASINEVAAEELALAHHGSIAKETRALIEDRLKRGQLPAIVATSSLELGIDMGAVDLVIQIEAPPTIASGIQRIGRAGHQVGAKSTGIVFPKYRGDLLACAAAAARMMQGEVEETFYARNPLDVLAQHVVAIVAEGTVELDEVFRLVRQAAPFHDLPRGAFESVVDLLAGRYPSDEFSELRPRVNWDRIGGKLSPRKSTQRLAIANAGTIPDRGLYSVFLAGDNGTSASRVGELDEEMVFETRPGDVFLLGASSWQVVDITSDRVLVVPAPGRPGKMPFWRGDGPGRPLEFGMAIGQLTRELMRVAPESATKRLMDGHGLEPRAAKNLVTYLHDQAAATGEPPSDRTVVVEAFLDEIGDWRVAVLTPFGARVHAPWATAVAARLREITSDEIDMMWSDDGMVFRIPEAHDLPPRDVWFPAPDEIEDMVVRELGSTAMFAGRFRENAARALLLPRRQPGRRTPLWLQRRRASNLLAVAARYPNFPLILETYRECLRDVFDLPGLRQILQSIREQTIRVREVRTEQASPFASSLLFNYTANFLYNGDTPLAERRAQTLALDHNQLCELLGTAELRELLCADAVEQTGLELQRLTDDYTVRDADELHDLLRHLGDLNRVELAARVARHAKESGQLDVWLTTLQSDRRILEIRVAGEVRYAAAEDAGRFRDALGTVLPPGLPTAFLQSPEDPLLDLVSRYARTHLPFTTIEVAQRWGQSSAAIQLALEKLASRGRVLEGEFLPGRRGREWTDPNVLRLLKRRSLAQLRKQVEPVEQAALARFLPVWQGIKEPRRGLDGLLDVVEQLQGLPLPASVWEDSVLPQRIAGYSPANLDELCAAGEVAWRGIESLGSDDGRIALYLADHVPLLSPAPQPLGADEEPVTCAVLECLTQRGAMFFDEIARHLGGFRNDVLDSLWRLVWAGHVTNDTLAPLRARRKPRKGSTRAATSRSRRNRFRSRRTDILPGSEGRWSLLFPLGTQLPDATTQQVAIATQLISRYGVLTREMIALEGLRGGFAAVYPVLKAMEEAGKVRRGYFVAGLGAAQFAAPGAEDQLRHPRRSESGDDSTRGIVMAATDPANPYGAALPWPVSTGDEQARPQRAAGARVILVDGQLTGYIGRTGQTLQTFLPEDQADCAAYRTVLAKTLAHAAQLDPILLNKVDGKRPAESELHEALHLAGFIQLSRGMLCRPKP